MLTVAAPKYEPLPALIDRAAKALVGARSSAEVLEAREIAGVAYDLAKSSARLLKAKGAHDDLVAAAHRAQAHSLEIEAQAKRRLADEYDAAQERGEVATVGGDRGNQHVAKAPKGNAASDLGLSRKQIHEAREVRDAEEEEPGIVRRTLEEALKTGEEPTRAKVKRAVKAKSKRKRTKRRAPQAGPPETQHDRDLRALLGMWESTCQSAREEFLRRVAR